jgi:hypothetical protein
MVLSVRFQTDCAYAERIIVSNILNGVRAVSACG